MNWDEIKDFASQQTRGLTEEYENRLSDEIREIEKQGAEGLWESYVNNKKCWNSNPNGLILPYLLKMVKDDPIKNEIKHKWVYQTDFPDIDVDFLPRARPFIKEYAIEKYAHVCSVGNWITYKPKLAIQDVVRALDRDKSLLAEAIELTKNLPDEFDELSMDDLVGYRRDRESVNVELAKEANREYNRFLTFYEYWDKHPRVIDIAFRLVGKIKTQGTHAGGIIIADRPLSSIIPLSYMGEEGKKSWTSQWTEGKTTQLSKFGLVKFDILGVRTIEYCWLACEYIKKSKGIIIDLYDIDFTSNPPRTGYEILPDGTKKVILLNDPSALQMCNELRTESVFQIETEIQKGIISNGEIRSFSDLVTFNALGRPGPMDCIPEYLQRRDDVKEEWKNGVDPRIVEILKMTYGIIVFQEDLTRMWREIGKFTVPEAEKARKIISKKWIEKLPDVERKWKLGASKEIGEDETNRWWDLMTDFGRYCFNKSHAVAYSLITYWCLYLKSHYPEEWWAAALSCCRDDKIPFYVGAAKKDNIAFGTLDVNALNENFTVLEGRIIPGLTSIKNIGLKTAKPFLEYSGSFKDLDDVVNKCGKNKIVMERLIKLGAFEKMCPNRNGLWNYYLYKYGTGDDAKEVKETISLKFALTDEEKSRRLEEASKIFFIDHPKKKALSKKIEKEVLKIKPSFNDVLGCFGDFSKRDILAFEKSFLGYYWSSLLDLFKNEKKQIKKIMDDENNIGYIEVVVEKIEKKISKKDNPYYQLYVNDGVQSIRLVVWVEQYERNKNLLKIGRGVKLMVSYNSEKKSFKLSERSPVIPLASIDGEEIEPQEEEVMVMEGDLW